MQICYFLYKFVDIHVAHYNKFKIKLTVVYML